MPKAGGVQGKLSEDDLTPIEALKTRTGSITMREICDELDAIGDVQEGVSFSTISRRLQKLPFGENIYKKKNHPHSKGETYESKYDLLTIMSKLRQQLGPLYLKLFDEAPVGERCIEVIRKFQSPNFTLNALTSLHDGVAYFNVLNRLTNTTQSLNFFDEVCDRISPATAVLVHNHCHQAEFPVPGCCGCPQVAGKFGMC